LNSSVYCRLGSLLSCISILRTGEVSNFLLYVKSRQGQISSRSARVNAVALRLRCGGRMPPVFDKMLWIDV